MESSLIQEHFVCIAGRPYSMPSTNDLKKFARQRSVLIYYCLIKPKQWFLRLLKRCPLSIPRSQNYRNAKFSQYYQNTLAARRLLLLSGDVELNPGWQSNRSETLQTDVESTRSSTSNLSIPVRISERLNPHKHVFRNPLNCVNINTNGLSVYNHLNDLSFCLMNTQSLNNKAAEFIDFICDHKPDIVALTETWFHEGETAARTLCTPTGYELLDHPRSGRHGVAPESCLETTLVSAKLPP